MKSTAGDRYDALVIGGGHNGLVAAAYLARAGKKVGVLERRAVLGGCCSTEELWPGFKVSPAAYVLSLFPPWLMEDLGLRRHGLELLPRDPSSFTPLPDGRFLLLGSDDRANREAIAKFSRADAEAFPQYEAFLARMTEALDPILTGPAPELPPRWRDLPLWWRRSKATRALGSEIRPALDLLLGAAGPFLKRWFESEVLQATLATDGVIGAFASPSTPGTGYLLLHHLMGLGGNQRGVWTYVRGGMGGMAQALAGACRELGVEIHQESAVTSIRCEAGRVSGVLLADGTFLKAPMIASNLDARRTLLELVGEGALPPESIDPIRQIDYQSASAKVNLALEDLPDFETGALPRADALRGTVHIAPSLDYMERAFDEAKYGRISRRPLLEITIPSTVDATLAPPGKHVMSIFVQYAPYHLEEGPWDETRREELADLCLDTLEAYAPNIRKIIRHRQVLSPVDLEQTYGLTGGHIFQGAMTLSQSGPLRSQAKTPIDGLWLCGAATHPGGGVMGLPGYYAARAMLKSLR